MKFKATGDLVKVNGRTIYRDGLRVLGYSATGVTFRFHGKKAKAVLMSDVEGRDSTSIAWVAVFINDSKEPSKRFALTKLEAEYVLYESETASDVTVTLMKYSELEFAKCVIKEMEVDADTLLPAPKEKKRKMEIIGDSITCGYGVEGVLEDMEFRTCEENPMKSYSLLTANALDAEAHIVAWNGKGVISAFVGEDDVPPDPTWRIPLLYEYTDAGSDKEYFGNEEEDWEKWDHSQYQADLVTIYLGTNDASYTREIPERNEEYAKAYCTFLDRIHETQPNAAILCMLGTMDRRLCETSQKAVEAYAKKHPDYKVEYLDLPAQLDEDGLGTFWHPTAVTQKKASHLVIQKVKEMMNW